MGKRMQGGRKGQKERIETGEGKGGKKEKLFCDMCRI